MGSRVRVPSRPQSNFRNPYKSKVYEGFFILGGRIGGTFVPKLLILCEYEKNTPAD